MFSRTAFRIKGASKVIRSVLVAAQVITLLKLCKEKRVYLGVKTCEVFLCFVAIVRDRSIMLTSLFSLFYVTGECHRFLHRG